MRGFIPLAPLALAVCTSGLCAQEPQPICVGTYNVKCPAPWDPDPRHGWKHRAPLVFELIRRHSPDVIGLQEPVREYIDGILSAFPEWDWAGAGRDDGRDAGEYSPVFWRKDRFERIDSGTFWLSGDCGRPGSRFPGARHPRVCTWATLRDRRTRRVLAFYNTHTEYVSSRMSSNSASNSSLPQPSSPMAYMRRLAGSSAYCADAERLGALGLR